MFNSFVIDHCLNKSCIKTDRSFAVSVPVLTSVLYLFRWSTRSRYVYNNSIQIQVYMNRRFHKVNAWSKQFIYEYKIRGIPTRAEEVLHRYISMWTEFLARPGSEWQLPLCKKKKKVSQRCPASKRNSLWHRQIIISDGYIALTTVMVSL